MPLPVCLGLVGADDAYRSLFDTCDEAEDLSSRLIRPGQLGAPTRVAPTGTPVS